MLDELLKHLKEITINVHVHYHGDNETLCLLRELKSQGEKIMATQKELADQLNGISDQLVKVGAETTTLIKTVDDLKAVIANGPEVTPELQQAVNKVAAQAKVVDDLVPDAPPPV